jgi:MoaA/NifB/PqqE/SkfB family radical SAM enzyme
MKNDETERPRTGRAAPGRAQVGQDGHIHLGEEEAGRLGIERCAQLGVERLPDGLKLLAHDVLPNKVYVELTTECNLDCGMCIRHSWEEPGGRMAPRTFHRILEQLAELPSVTTIQFGGFGEPLMHPDFFDFVAIAKGVGREAEVITNGLLLDVAAAEQCIEEQVDRLIVSVDGLRPETHPLLHTSDFGTVHANLRRLYQLRRLRGVPAPEIGLEFVATKRNIGELPALRRLAVGLGFTSILVTNPIPYTPELADEILYEQCTTTPRRRGSSVYTPVVDLPHTDACPEVDDVVRQLVGSAVRLRRNGTDLAGAGPRCRFVTEGRFAISWSGHVSPCLALLHSHAYYFRGRRKRVECYHLGNVDDRPLADIWADERSRAFRARVRDWDFSPCIDCGGCDLRDTNDRDCFGNAFPRCGECLWAAGIVQCP